MLNNVNIRSLLLLGLLVATCFMYALSENHINTIKKDNPKLFSEEVEPSAIKTDCPNGLNVDQECDENISFSAEDQLVIKQRESIIGMYNDINVVCFYLSIVLAIALVYFLWIDNVGRKTKKQSQQTEEMII